MALPLNRTPYVGIESEQDIVLCPKSWHYHIMLALPYTCFLVLATTISFAKIYRYMMHTLLVRIVSEQDIELCPKRLMEFLRKTAEMSD